MDVVRVFQRTRLAVSGAFLGDGLRARATRGGAWLGGGSVAEQSCRFARNMLLTRLLAPNAFGIMAIVLSSQALISSFTDVGVWPAVIHNPRGGEDRYLNAAWWFGIGRSILIYAVVFFAAPWIASFYGNAELSKLLRVALLSLVLDGMLSPRAKLAQKQMKFSRWAFISNGGAICGVILTIVLSFILRDVWALAIGYCAENVFRCLFSYIACPGLPSLRWDKEAFHDLMKFSRGMVGLSFLNLVFARSDIFVIGKLCSPAALGLYTMAIFLVQAPSGFIVNMLSTALLPAFSHVQADKERLNRMLSEVTSWVILIGLPAVAMIWLCGPSLLTLTYGARYAASSGALVLAACVALLNTLNSQLTIVFYAAGRPALHRRAVAASAIVMLLAIYPACKYFGLIGGQIAALLAIVCSFVLQIARARRITGFSLLNDGRALVRATLVSAGIVIVGAAVRFLGLATRPLDNIAVATAACIVAYALSVPAFMKAREIA